MNSLADADALRHARVSIWETLGEEEYTISLSTLHGGVKQQALEMLHRVGLVRLRWQGDPPTPARLQSLENWIGVARTEQNDYQGRVKSLVPKATAPATTGDSALALAPHVDGTQDDRTPAIVAFQYDYSSTWGGESQFVDMAAMLATVPSADLERILTVLARRECASCTKVKGAWSKTYKGPLVRAEGGGRSISVRLREDDLLEVDSTVEAEFAELKRLVASWAAKHRTTYTPHEGDVVVFDNWRVLHARAEIGGRHQRIHDRIWIDTLLPEHAGKYLTGIRPLRPRLVDAILRANDDQEP